MEAPPTDAADVKLLCGKFELGALIRRGPTGVVHRGRRLDGAVWSPVVLKLEACDSRKKQMKREVQVYEALRQHKETNGFGFARASFATGELSGDPVNVLAMEPLGRTISDVVKQQPMSERCARLLAVRLTRAVQVMHGLGFVHRDIKPENVCTSGLEATRPDRLYVIDFGLAAHWRQEDGSHFSPSTVADAECGRVAGSAKYASVHAHQAVSRGKQASKDATRSRRCDLESVAYVALFAMRGNLPWSKSPLESMGTKKLELPPDELFGCRRLGNFLAEARKLRFEEKPDYDRFVDLIWTAGESEAADWEPVDPYAGMPAPQKHDFDASRKPPKRRSLSSSTATKKKARFSDATPEEWVLEGLGNGGAGAVAALAETEEDDSVAKWRAKLSKSKPTDKTDVTATLARLAPHLRNEKKLPRAAPVLAKLLLKAELCSYTSEVAVAEARLSDALALRDALALALNGARVLHKPALRVAYIELFDAALSRSADFPPRCAAEIGLWALAASAYNALLLHSASSARPAVTAASYGEVLPRVLRCLRALEVASQQDGAHRRTAAEIRLAKRTDESSALTPPSKICGARGFDCLVALGDCYREPWAPRDDIFAAITLALSLSPEVTHFNPLQRRKLETLSSTLRATRQQAQPIALWGCCSSDV